MTTFDSGSSFLIIQFKWIETSKSLIIITTMINHINKCSVLMKRSIKLKNENMFDICQVNYYLEELKKHTNHTTAILGHPHASLSLHC